MQENWSVSAGALHPSHPGEASPLALHPGEATTPGPHISVIELIQQHILSVVSLCTERVIGFICLLRCHCALFLCNHSAEAGSSVAMHSFVHTYLVVD